MKYYVETWSNEQELCSFETEQERKEWLEENCNLTESGGYLKETGERVAIYEY